MVMVRYKKSYAEWTKTCPLFLRYIVKRLMIYKTILTD